LVTLVVRGGVHLDKKSRDEEESEAKSERDPEVALRAVLEWREPFEDMDEEKAQKEPDDRRSSRIGVCDANNRREQEPSRALDDLWRRLKMGEVWW